MPGEVQNYDVLDSDGHIVNIVLWDGESEWSPGPGFTVRLSTPESQIYVPPQD